MEIPEDLKMWAVETCTAINKLTPDIKGKAFDPDWFLIRQRFDAIVYRLAASEAEVKRLREQVDWKPITPDSLPKVGDEIGIFGEKESFIHLCQNEYTFDVWCIKAWTHYRPINAPAEPREDADNGTK